VSEPNLFPALPRADPRALIRRARSLRELAAVIRRWPDVAVGALPARESIERAALPTVAAAALRLVPMGPEDSLGSVLSRLGASELRRAQISPELERLILDGLRDYVAGRLGPPEPEAGAEGSPEPRMDPLAPGMTRAELEAWSSAAGVREWTLALALNLPDLRAQARSWLQIYASSHSVADLLCGPPAGGPLRASGDPARDVYRAAIRWLRGAAAQVQRAVEAERARAAGPSPPLEPPSLAALRDRLALARVNARAEQLPVPLPDGAPHLRLHADPARLQVEAVGCPPRGYGPRPVVSISLDELDPALLARCDEPSCGGGCRPVLEVLDRAIRLLEAPGPEAERLPQIAALLERPRWSRLLSHLDAAIATLPAVMDPAAPPAATSRLGWRLGCRGARMEAVPVECRPGRKGEFKPYKLAFERALQDPRIERSDADRAALAELRAQGDWDPRPTASRNHRAVAAALEHLVGHPLLFGPGKDSRRASVERQDLSLAWTLQSDRLSWRVQLGGKELDSRTLDWMLGHPNGERAVLYDEDSLRFVLVPLPEPRAAVLRAMSKAPRDLEPEAAPAVLGRIESLARVIPVQLDGGLEGEERGADASPILRVEPLSESALRFAVRVRPLSDSGPMVPGAGSERIYGTLDGRRVFARRQLDEELRRAMDLARSLDLDADAAVHGAGMLTPLAPDGLQILLALEERDPKPAVDWVGSPRRRVRRLDSARSLRIRLRSLGDWFGVGGRADLDGAELPIEDLIAAIEAGKRFVRLGGGDWAAVGEELRRAVISAFGAVERRKGATTLSPLHAPALQALADSGAELDASPEWMSMLDRMREASARTPEPPAELAPVLRPYQREGFQWAARLAGWAGGACLADDMGLGKTIQALALLRHRAERGPALVVAPTSVGWNWLREAASFAPSLRVREHRGRGREELLRDLRPGDVVVTSWALLLRDEAALVQPDWATFVLDEAQAIKNPETERAKAARAVRAEFRLALTGTPLENRSEELWSLFRVLLPGLLGSRESFRERFAVPIEARRDEERRAALASMVRPFLLRRVKAAVAPELPARTEVVRRVQLGPEERQLYERVRNSALSALRAAEAQGSGLSGLRFHALAALTRLRQIACHPRLFEPSSAAASSKERALLRLLEDLRAEGHRALVFSQFTELLGLLRPALEAAGHRCLYLDGSTPAGTRRALVDRFQGGEGDVFLISLKAGGTGLNLTAATYVIHLDPWWNPAVEAQAADRAHRIGQTQPVTIYRLVAEATVEDAILQMQAEKRDLVEALLAGTDRAGPMAVEDLLGLLGGG
jgi:superfamily II DNA or RNA helicase